VFSEKEFVDYNTDGDKMCESNKWCVTVNGQFQLDDIQSMDDTPDSMDFSGEMHKCVADDDQGICDDIGNTCKTWDEGLESPFSNMKTKKSKTTVCCCKKDMCNEKSSAVMVSATMAWVLLVGLWMCFF